MSQTRLKFSDQWSADDVLAPGNRRPQPVYATELGVLFNGDCLAVLPSVQDATVDTVFADPPFNLGKVYGGSVNDELPDHDYLNWSRRWIDECIGVLQPA